MTRTPLLRRLRQDTSGVTAVEYAFVLPVFMMMVLGGLWVGLLSYAVSSLNFTVESAARCMSVDANACATATDTQTYAAKIYNGPSISPTFLASTAGCGHTVSAQANFDLAILPGLSAVPLTASACYP
jgi:Flp pilus assembly protein TadG